MKEDSNELEPLPTEKLPNRWGKGNPIQGDGTLGNKKTGYMYYAGKEKKNLVLILQNMLKTLDYDLGTSGTQKNGVDGIFGDITEEDVLDFQGKNKDWDGKNLKVDVLVGPEKNIPELPIQPSLKGHNRTCSKCLPNNPGVKSLQSRFTTILVPCDFCSSETFSFIYRYG